MKHRLRMAGRREGGQTVILAAISLVVLLGFLGLAIDVGRLYATRQQLRRACDAAAQAGVAELPGSPSAALAKGFEYYCRNVGGTAPSSPANDTVYTIAGTNDTVRAISPYSGDGRRLYISAQRTVPSLFVHVIGISSEQVAAHAVGAVRGRATTASVYASGLSAGGGEGRTTQPLDFVRADGQRYAVVIDGNNERLGVDSSGQVVVGDVVSAQNVYVDSNNTIGAAVYGDAGFANYAKGNSNTSDTLLNPTLQTPRSTLLIDPSYYLDQATAQGHVITGNRTFDRETVSGFYFVYGDITIRRQVLGTATFAATGRVFTEETGSSLTAADTQNHLLFYAGCDPALDPGTYFSGTGFDPNNRFIHLNDNNTSYTGSMYAPYGHIEVESNHSTIIGSLVGDTLALTQYANNITIRYDANWVPPVMRGSALIE